MTVVPHCGGADGKGCPQRCVLIDGDDCGLGGMHRDKAKILAELLGRKQGALDAAAQVIVKLTQERDRFRAERDHREDLLSAADAFRLKHLADAKTAMADRDRYKAALRNIVDDEVPGEPVDAFDFAQQLADVRDYAERVLAGGEP